MPGRTFAVANGYRYGFNGKELDVDIQESEYDYGFRIYNPSLGKFLSVDPLKAKYPQLTPYQFAANKPIWAIDLDGLEDTYYTVNIVKNGTGDVAIKNITEDETKRVTWYNDNVRGKLGAGEVFKINIETQDMDGKPIGVVTVNYFLAAKKGFFSNVFTTGKSSSHGGGLFMSSSDPNNGSENWYEPSATNPDHEIVKVDLLMSTISASISANGVENVSTMLDGISKAKDYAKILANEIEIFRIGVYTVDVGQKTKDVLIPSAETANPTASATNVKSTPTASVQKPPSANTYSAPPGFVKKQNGGDSSLEPKQARKEWNKYYKKNKLNRVVNKDNSTSPTKPK